MHELLAEFTVQDLIAFLFFIGCWAGYAFYTRSMARNHSLLTATNKYRVMWMRSMLKRDNRSVDAIITGNLMRSITFSANTTIFILAGLIGMFSYHKEMSEIISAIPYAKPMTPLLWEMKILLLIFIFVYAFFKYTWSLRQQNYTSILIGSAPLHHELTPEADEIARRAAFLAGNAAEHFNNGLRAYYFGLATLSWFIHPYLYMATTALVVFVTQRREFRSHTLKRLLSDA